MKNSLLKKSKYNNNSLNHKNKFNNKNFKNL